MGQAPPVLHCSATECSVGYNGTGGRASTQNLAYNSPAALERHCVVLTLEDPSPVLDFMRLYCLEIGNNCRQMNAWGSLSLIGTF